MSKKKNNGIRLGVLTFYLTAVQSYHFLASKMIANVHLLTLIYNEILHISSLKMSFHTDRYCQILISIHKHMISIEHIHLLKGIYRIMLGFSLDTCLLVCHSITD